MTALPLPLFVLRLARLFVVLLLALAVSGLPRVALAAAGMDDPSCVSDCGDPTGKKHCAPACSVAACAKLAPFTPLPEAPDADAPAPRRAPSRIASAASEPIPSPSLESVFHPPRA